MTIINKMIKETYEEYLQYMIDRKFEEQWVYNILDGVAESDKVIYRDDLL